MAESRMNKTEAITLVNEKYGLKLDSRNTHYSKENAGKPVWWYELPLSKIHDTSLSDIYLIAERRGELKLFKVPTEYFRKNLSGFKIRDDKQVLCLEIDVVLYKNRVGTGQSSFTKFVL